MRLSLPDVALPVFCLTVFLVRLLGERLQSAGRSALQKTLSLQFVLLFAGAVFAIGLGPFENADRAPAILTRLTLVAAMATQNAAHRLHLASTPLADGPPVQM